MTEIIYGRHPVLAALRRPESPLEEVIVAQGVGGPWLDEVRRLARAAKVRFRVQERAALDRLCGTPHHQGIMARRGAYVYRSEADLLDRLPELTEPALLVAADSLTDPMNLGNLCRSALSAGAQGVIIPKDRAVGVTPAVAKAAAGALEYLPVYRVTNLAQCLMQLKEAGLFVIGADAGASQSHLPGRPHRPPGPGHRRRRQGPAPPGAAAMRPGPGHPPGRPGNRLAQRRHRRGGGAIRGAAAATGAESQHRRGGPACPPSFREAPRWRCALKGNST